MTISFEEIDNKDRVIKLNLSCNILTISSLSAEFPKGQVFHQADVDEMIPLFKRAVEEMERYKAENPEDWVKQDVNYISQHKGAFEKMREMDLSPIHISLYNTLFLIWNYSGWEEKISISRQEVMSMAKIGSANTYLAALKELDKVGMIKYTPSHNPMKGSIVNLYRFDTTTDTSSDTTSGTSTDTTPATLSKRINSKTEKQTNNDLVFPFSGARFLELWANANQIPKWKKKTQNAHQMTLQKLGKFSEEVACAMLEKSIAGDYQGVFDLSAVEIKNIELTARLNNSKPKVDPNNQY